MVAWLLDLPRLMFPEVQAFAKHRQAAGLPRELLHPAIADKAWHHFIAGDYEVAVFAALKALEIAVA